MVLAIADTGVIGISPHANNTLSKILIRATRNKEINSLDYKVEHSKGTSDLLLPAKKSNDTSTYSDHNERVTHTMKTFEIIHNNLTNLNESVPRDAVREEIAITSDSILNQRRDVDDSVNDIVKDSSDPSQPTKIFRKDRRSLRESQCPSQNHRSLCRWRTETITNNTRVPQDIQVATCVSSTPLYPLSDAGLSDIRCENITIVKKFRLVNCAQIKCTERVEIPIGCIPVFRCHRYPPP